MSEYSFMTTAVSCSSLSSAQACYWLCRSLFGKASVQGAQAPLQPYTLPSKDSCCSSLLRTINLDALQIHGVQAQHQPP